MISDFTRYFLRSITNAKSRQKLLFLAMFGLFLSSFALIVLQSTMGGLQDNLINRGKKLDGHAVIEFSTEENIDYRELQNDLSTRQFISAFELELEVLIKNGAYLSPIVARGLDEKHPLRQSLATEFVNEKILVGGDLAYKVKVEQDSQVELISPGHTDMMMGEIPRSITMQVQQVIMTDSPEKDLYFVWLDQTPLQNIIKKRHFNRLRIFSKGDFKELKKHLNFKYQDKMQLKTWEQQNDTLMRAFKLESSVMVFLFVMMTLLVSVAISSGLLIFFNKIKLDLISLWILGLTKEQIQKNMFSFLNFTCVSIILLGLTTGVISLVLFDLYAPEIMPDIFVDRKIPVKIEFKGLMLSFIFPYLICLLFGKLSLKQFKRENDNYLTIVRSIGR
jgi:lipoprotein-releasing system permease protein